MKITVHICLQSLNVRMSLYIEGFFLIPYLIEQKDCIQKDLSFDNVISYFNFSTQNYTKFNFLKPVMYCIM